MFENSKRTGWWIVVAVVIGLVCSSQARGRKAEQALHARATTQRRR